MLVCAIFAAATASSTIKMFSQGKTLSGVMGIFLFAALMTPVFRILRRAYRRACAHRIAGALLPLTEESLTFDQLGTVLSSGKALEQLQSLIGTGYLQNLRINAATRTVGCIYPRALSCSGSAPAAARRTAADAAARHAAHTAVSRTQNDSQPTGIHDSKKTADFRATPGNMRNFQASSIVRKCKRARQPFR